MLSTQEPDFEERAKADPEEYARVAEKILTLADERADPDLFDQSYAWFLDYSQTSAPSARFFGHLGAGRALICKVSLSTLNTTHHPCYPSDKSF